MSKDKSKLYRDRDKGMIRVNLDSTVPETEVHTYAATLKRKANVQSTCS